MFSSVVYNNRRKRWKKCLRFTEKNMLLCQRDIGPDVFIYREFKTPVLRSIQVLRFITPVVEHLKLKLRKRGKEATGVFN